MRSLVYYIAASIDGYIATPDGKVDPFLMSGPHADEFVARLSDFDTVLMGANTYRFGLSLGLTPGAPAYPGLIHHVFSRSLQFESTDEVILSADDPSNAVSNLKQMPGRPIWLCGGGALAATLAEACLIDELWLKVNPIVLGSGIPFLGNVGIRRRLELTASKRYENGVLLSTYRIV